MFYKIIPFVNKVQEQKKETMVSWRKLYQYRKIQSNMSPELRYRISL